MPRRMGYNRAPRPRVVTYKHMFNQDTSYAGADANNFHILYQGGAPGSSSSIVAIPAGNRVYSVDVTVSFVNGSANAGGTWAWMLVYLRDGQDITSLIATSGAPRWSNVGLSNIRNQVIKTFMGVVGTEDGSTLNMTRHISIPKIYQRIREGDQLQLIFVGDQAGSLSTGSRFKDYS